MYRQSLDQKTQKSKPMNNFIQQSLKVQNAQEIQEDPFKNELA